MRSRPMSRLIVIALMLVALVSGCATMSPDYERPEAPVAEAYPQASASDSELRATDIGWRDFFQDQRLLALIETALVHNRDLRVAVLNIDAARAAYDIQAADRLPGLDAQGSLT